MLNYLITLRYVKLFAYKSARYLQEAREESHQKRYLYYYGFQVIYGGINKFLLLIILGLLLGILPELLVVTLSFMILRVWAGGLHFDSYTACAYVSLLSLTTMGLLAKFLQLHQTATITIFTTILITFLIYAPLEHPNRPIRPKDRQKFKIIAVTLLIVLFIAKTLLKGYVLSNSIVYGVWLAGIIALPVFNKRSKNVE